MNKNNLKRCSSYYVLNTNERYQKSNATNEMLKMKKALCYGPAKIYLKKLKKSDVVYLYQNKIGIIAYGIVASKVFYKGNEAYVKLDNFINITKKPIKFPYNPHTLYKPSMEKVKLLPKIYIKENGDNISFWLLPSKDNELKKHFAKEINITWYMNKQVSINKNDIIYIYGTNSKSIQYKCKADSNIKKVGDKYIFKMMLLFEYDEYDERMSYKSLKFNGLLSTIQSAEKIKGNLLNYINRIDKMIDLYKKIGNNNIQNIDSEIINCMIDNNVYTQETNNVLERQMLTIVKGKQVPLRSPIRAVNALKNAKYICEYNSEDKVFRRKSGINYTESHHLIPISKYKDFKYSLDVEANIVSLCCYCHRILHYGNLGVKKTYIKKAI